ncbi:hypothetical protein IEI94_18780 [Halomonas sp. ML-15]|uniref:hypothetical protein n=1 Tax=Halomonas sp. ML-15 TaxID=2773305 RepID=UPI0017467F95|nr:hypothetical protein [Halomonas sp. ML-15]MBD3897906.1 hypothetical protein [Halomonas sp. ML-15]
MKTLAQDYNWSKELEKTVVNSLATSFGLDFLLFEDKVGGNVDTVHNARQGIWASDSEKQRYENREKYDSHPYHTHENYINTGKRDKPLHQAGDLHDPYRNTTMGAGDERHLDHVISAKEIHNDPGRILAESDGVELANKDSNLQSTQGTVNRSKNATSIDAYLDKLPGTISTHESTLAMERQKLENHPRNTPQQQHEARKLEDKIRKTEDKIEQLKAIDPDSMRERDAEARRPYEQQINRSYYTSSKFLKQTATASGISGLKMGTRQMLGLIMAEVWFELREQIPTLLKECKVGFDFSSFIDSINKTLKGIWRRVKVRFKSFLTAFKDGVFGGVFASLTTTIFNVFATTQRMAVKIIREVWMQLVKAIKLLIFNPDKLGFVDLCRAVVSVLSIGAATAVGTVAYTQLLPICNFPLGAELAAFSSALITGVVTLGLTYIMLHSGVANKVWEFIDSIMPHAASVAQFEAINAELDQYLADLSKLEFNLNAEELEEFSKELMVCNDEIQRGMYLEKETTKRGIDLPYEMGNSESTRKWLASCIIK